MNITQHNKIRSYLFGAGDRPDTQSYLTASSVAYQLFFAWCTDGKLVVEDYNRSTPGGIDELFMRLCGKTDLIKFLTEPDDNDRRILKMLGGEHAWCVYKMLALEDK